MSEGGCKASCYQEGVGYASTCNRCFVTQQGEGRPAEDTVNFTYTGETVRQIFTRAKQHLDAYKSHQPGRKPVESWMWEHTVCPTMLVLWGLIKEQATTYSDFKGGLKNL